MTDVTEAARIEGLIKKPPQNSRVLTVSPEIAMWVLESYNIGNRPIKPNKIMKYAADMERGAWALTGDTIKFSANGLLRDGQNRLRACIRSGKPFTTHCVFGVPDDSFHVMDTGKNRSQGDVLSIAGYKNAATLAAALRWYKLLASGNPLGRGTISNDEALQMIKKLPDIQDSLPPARRVYSIYHHPTGQLVALHYMMHKVDPEKADAFFDLWARGVVAGPAKPIATLQAELVKLRDMTLGRVHDCARAGMIINAWNLFVSGQKGSANKIHYDRVKPFPTI